MKPAAIEEYTLWAEVISTIASVEAKVTLPPASADGKEVLSSYGTLVPKNIPTFEFTNI